ncbi:hypothetical protein QL093DRAFT_2015599 [Fusarium oxysporum]|nr:hypothetical protein QL093DRAFT_2015599 [Fusarium oxysporum]
MASSRLSATTLAKKPVTPHEQYSSSVGVLGCKINTNRVAYWPDSVGCDDICIRVATERREVYLLKVDASGGAYDISYDAWNFLVTGKSATESPAMGGGIFMTYEVVDPTYCVPLLQDGKLPLAAANSMNYLANCLQSPNSWVATHYVLYNIVDSTCKYGVDEICYLDLTISNQAQCPSGLGVLTPVGLDVKNIIYGTGKEEKAP